MRINKVQTNNNTTLQFKANMIDSAALRRFKAGLSPQKAKELDSYINKIEKSKDNNTYIFDVLTIMNKPKERKIAIISTLNKDKSINTPPVFSEIIENAMNVFKKLAESIK